MSVPLLLVALHATLAAAAPSPARARDCLRYEPDTVVITGRLVRRTFFGPPTFGENPAQDVRERGYYLRLAAPVCTRGSGAPGSLPPVRGVHSVQLILDSAGYAVLRPMLGRTVRLSGTLSIADNGHHHAPLLLQVIPGRRAGEGQ